MHRQRLSGVFDIQDCERRPQELALQRRVEGRRLGVPLLHRPQLLQQGGLLPLRRPQVSVAHLSPTLAQVAVLNPWHCTLTCPLSMSACRPGGGGGGGSRVGGGGGRGSSYGWSSRSCPWLFCFHKRVCMHWSCLRSRQDQVAPAVHSMAAISVCRGSDSSFSERSYAGGADADLDW